MRVYFTNGSQLYVGVIVNVLPDMLVTMSLDSFSYVFNMEMLLYALPALIGSLNVMVIILDGNALVLFAGSVLIMVGGVVSVVVLLVVKLDVNVFVRLFPVRSVMLFAGMVRVYRIPCAQLLVDVMVSVLLVMVLVMFCAVFVFVFMILMLL